MSIETPVWISDNDLIQRLLNKFIDQCENGNTVRFQQTINVKSAKELFDFDNQDREILWSLIDLKLRQKHHIIERIQYRNLGVHAEHYDNAIIYFNRNYETLARQWLKRPAKQSYTLQWQNALEHYPHFKKTSLAQPIKINNVKADDILKAMATLEQELFQLKQQSEKISLRGISARCFWGDSKVLDKRRDLINDVFELAPEVIEPRALMLSVFVPETLEKLIFVENFDSFLTTVKAINRSTLKLTTAVVYSAGYRGSAHLIRDLGQSHFVTINSVNNEVFQKFEQWWFKQNYCEVDTYFWGDLDFEGINILNALNNNFHQTQAWLPGYSLLLEYHDNGLGHEPKLANKQHQKRPNESQCAYTNNNLIPCLLNSNRFIDQEVVNEAQLVKQIACQKKQNLIKTH